MEISALLLVGHPNFLLALSGLYLFSPALSFSSDSLLSMFDVGKPTSKVMFREDGHMLSVAPWRVLKSFITSDEVSNTWSSCMG